MGVCKNHPYLRPDLVFLHQLYIVLLQLNPNLFFLGVLFHWLCEVWASHSLSMYLFHLSNGPGCFNYLVLICRVLKAILG